MRYHNITKDDMLNGDGLRVVLWVSGCDHCCKECQNPITWDPNSGLIFDESAKKELFDELEKSYVSGITFSGGDPLHANNIYEIKELAKEIRTKFPEKTIWLYTGCTWEAHRQDRPPSEGRGQARAFMRGGHVPRGGGRSARNLGEPRRVRDLSLIHI